MIKTHIKVSIEGTYSNTIQAIYEKPEANIILNNKKLKASSLNSGTRQGCPLFPLSSLIIVLEILAKDNKTRKRNKVIYLFLKELSTMKHRVGPMVK